MSPADSRGTVLGMSGRQPGQLGETLRSARIAALRALRKAVARTSQMRLLGMSCIIKSVDGEPDNVGRTTLSDEKRKALIAAAVVFFCFPFVWPAKFGSTCWLQSLLVSVTTYLILRRRRSS